MKILGLKNLSKQDITDLFETAYKVELEKAVVKDTTNPNKKKKEEDEEQQQGQQVVNDLKIDNKLNRNEGLVVLIQCLQNSKLFKLEGMEKVVRIINDENSIGYDQLLDYLCDDRNKQSINNMVLNSQILASQIDRYFQLNRLQELLSLAVAVYMESNNVDMQIISRNIERKSNQKMKNQVCDELMNLLHGSQLATRKGCDGLQKWVNLLTQIRSIQQTKLEIMQDQLQTDNIVQQQQIDQVKYLELQLNEDSLGGLLRYLMELLGQQFGLDIGVQQDNNGQGLQQRLEQVEKMVKQQIEIGLTKLNELYLKINEKDSKKVKQLGLGRGVKEVIGGLVETKHDVLGFVELVSTSNMDLIQKIRDNLLSKNDERRKPKIPKGTRDFEPQQMAIRSLVFQKIRKIFRKHGAVELDTPVFELKETLTGKYGEDSKLIYDLEDQGGEMLSLRYDLTVPLARYLGLKNIQSIKRFQIGKVYRRDNPQISKGRFREFYQMDFDIAGQYDQMMPDCEVIKIVDEILSELEIGKYIIKVNNRKILDAMIEVIGAPKQKFNTICSSIDKLDKESWETVECELIEQKGLTKDMTTVLAKMVEIKGQPSKVIAQIKEQNLFVKSEIGMQGLQEMELLFGYLESMDVNTAIFDLSLARGLDYYTGTIMESVLMENDQQLGSISGGGRYDGLVGMFANKSIPVVGASIGIERVFSILETKMKNIRSTDTKVIVATVGSDMVHHKLKLLNMLWSHGIPSETVYSTKPKPQKQLSQALTAYVPFMIWIGQDEINKAVYKLKNMYLQTEEDVPHQDLIPILNQRIEQYNIDLQNGNVHFKEDTQQQDNPRGKREKKEKKSKKE